MDRAIPLDLPGSLLCKFSVKTFGQISKLGIVLKDRNLQTADFKTVPQCDVGLDKNQMYPRKDPHMQNFGSISH